MVVVATGHIEMKAYNIYVYGFPNMAVVMTIPNAHTASIKAVDFTPNS